MKPLFRWTIGDVHPRGFLILNESIQQTLLAFGADNFDWVVCHNRLSPEQKDYLKEITKDTPVELYEQDWQSCPLVNQISSNRDTDNNFNTHGTMWKICPPRLRKDAHEIIADNDVVFFKPFKELNEFLNQDKTLVSEDYLNFYGRYLPLFQKNEKYNSGFIGLPPGFDFETEIKKTWEQHGRYNDLKSDDEQGLITYSLTRNNFILVPMRTLTSLPRDLKFIKHIFTGDEIGMHFLQANTHPFHQHWNAYKSLKNKPKYKLIKRTS